MIIDFHVHCYPEHLAQKITDSVPRPSGVVPACHPSFSCTKEKMQAWGVDRFVLLPVATTPHAESPNQFAAALKDDDMAICFGTVHPAMPNVEAEVEHIAELGLRGIKLHPQYSETYLDDPRYIRIIRRAAKVGLPIVFHAGGGPDRPTTLMAEPRHILNMLRQVEDLEGLTLIAAHMGALDMFDLAEQQLMGRNMFIDTSFVAGRLPLEQFGRMIEKHGYERVLFGSDSPWQAADISLDFLRRLHLPTMQENAILSGNAIKILSL